MTFKELLQKSLDRQTSEEIVANNASNGQVAGVTGEPPVNLKRKNKTVLGFIKRMKKYMK